MMLAGFLQRLGCIFCFRNDCEVALIFQQSAQPLTNKHMIMNQNATNCVSWAAFRL